MRFGFVVCFENIKMVDETHGTESFRTTLKKFEELCVEPEKFLSVDGKIKSELLKSSKELYDSIKSCECNESKTHFNKSLLIKGFDNEQVWQQLQLNNNPSLNQSKRIIKQLKQGSINFIPGQTINKENKNTTQNNEIIIEQENDEDFSNDEGEENEFDDDKEYSDSEQKVTKKYKSSIVDDDFFKLRQMEEFLDEQDRLEMEEEAQDKSEDEGDDVNYFQSGEVIDSDDERMKNARFKDFFAPPSKSKSSKKSNKIEETSNADEEIVSSDIDENEDEKESEESSNEEPENENKVKSKFEENQKTMAEKIIRLEEANLKKKEWQLQGESSAKQRPVNSLLEEHVSFDHTSVGAPVITEETTETLEDTIKQRIKDQAWDDVKRKEKPIREAFEYKRAPELNSEKSKMSLAQVYEKEYLKQTQETEEDKEKGEHVEIRGLMTKLFSKLNALSNHHFTPKPPQPELKIVTNAPSLQMEEVTPVTHAQASSLAPEEIFEKQQRDFKGGEEKTETDRKHERRQKKIKKKFAAKERENKIARLDGKVGKASDKRAALEQLKKGVRNTIVSGGESGDKVKSSSQFFTKLQKEVKEGISKNKKTAVKSKKLKNNSAHFLKL